MTDARDADTFNAETYLDSAGRRIRLRPRGLGHHFLRMRRFNSARGLQSSWTLFMIYHPAGRERVEDTPQGLRGGGDEQVNDVQDDTRIKIDTRGASLCKPLACCNNPCTWNVRRKCNFEGWILEKRTANLGDLCSNNALAQYPSHRCSRVLVRWPSVAA